MPALQLRTRCVRGQHLGKGWLVWGLSRQTLTASIGHRLTDRHAHTHTHTCMHMGVAEKFSTNSVCVCVRASVRACLGSHFVRIIVVKRIWGGHREESRQHMCSVLACSIMMIGFVLAWACGPWMSSRCKAACMERHDPRCAPAWQSFEEGGTSAAVLTHI